MERVIREGFKRELKGGDSREIAQERELKRESLREETQERKFKRGS